VKPAVCREAASFFRRTIAGPSTASDKSRDKGLQSEAVRSLLISTFRNVTVQVVGAGVSPVMGAVLALGPQAIAGMRPRSGRRDARPHYLKQLLPNKPRFGAAGQEIKRLLTFVSYNELPRLLSLAVSGPFSHRFPFSTARQRRVNTQEARNRLSWEQRILVGLNLDDGHRQALWRSSSGCKN